VHDLREHFPTSFALTFVRLIVLRALATPQTGMSVLEDLARGLLSSHLTDRLPALAAAVKAYQDGTGTHWHVHKCLVSSL
jgi:hypothetical protein